MIPTSLETAVYGLVTAPALHVVIKHGVLTHLSKTGGRTAAEVAGELHLDADTTDRLLLVLAAAGIVQLDSGGVYTVAGDVAPFLDPHDSSFIGGFLQHLVDGTPGRLERLNSYLDQGKAVTDATVPTAYEHLYRDDESTSEFMTAMWTLSHGVSRELASLSGLDGARTLVDVGGANGPFAVAALQRHPALRAVVFDLPQVGPHLLARARSEDLTDRLSFVAGDFFRDDLPHGDVIALGYVMSNWPDDECVALLRAAHRACVPGGRVLVMDRLFTDDRAGPMATATMNLLMQVETHGRHRTVAEYTAMLELAGFTDCEVRFSSLDKHLIIGHCPEGTT